MQLTITPLSEAGVEVLPPDILWNGISGDFAVARRPEDGGAGGLVAANPLKTAVVMLLFTDARPPATHPLALGRGDLRGWAGDGFDVNAASGEEPLGSYLWLYRRSELSFQIGFDVEIEVKRALRPLKNQGAVASIDAKAIVDEEHDTLFLVVNLYARDGTSLFSAKYDPLWRRADGRL